MDKLIRKLLIILAVVTGGSLLTAYSSTWISPVKFWLPAFFGLAYPYILLVAVGLTLVLFTIRMKKTAFVLLLIIFLGWGHFNRFFRIPLPYSRHQYTDAQEKKHLDVLTYNVRLFNNYIRSSSAADSIFSLIRNTEADVVCLQEIYTGGQISENDLIQNVGLPYYRFNYLHSDTRNLHYGLAIFSRYPIIDGGIINYPATYNTSMYCDIVVEDDTLRIFNNHLQSTRLKKMESLFSASTGQGESMKEFLEISVKLRDAFRLRAQQATLLKDHISASPFRVVVCGDFNDTPVSYAYHKISGGLNDAFLSRGRWLGKTYAGILPEFRIDYILSDKELLPADYRRYKKRYSDHFPVKARIILSLD